jgi:wobble nucleotide-excising tRNase
MTIQNTLRRIIESYFKLLGNLDKDDIVRKFEGQDQVICASLFSWVNDGSHSVHDDLYISQDEQAVDRYLEIFKQIFVRTDHAGHYAMMMNTEETGSPTAAVAPAVMAQIAG